MNFTAIWDLLLPRMGKRLPTKLMGWVTSGAKDLGNREVRETGIEIPRIGVRFPVPGSRIP
jgi:hypothetical protein